MFCLNTQRIEYNRFFGNQIIANCLQGVLLIFSFLYCCKNGMFSAHSNIFFIKVGILTFPDELLWFILTSIISINVYIIWLCLSSSVYPVKWQVTFTCGAELSVNFWCGAAGAEESDRIGESPQVMEAGEGGIYVMVKLLIWSIQQLACEAMRVKKKNAHLLISLLGGNNGGGQWKQIIFLVLWEKEKKKTSALIWGYVFIYSALKSSKINIVEI